MDNQTTWKIIHSYFEENPQALVAHHIESYNDFFKNGIFQLLKEKNPIQINSKYDETLRDFKYQCSMYFGGKDGTKVYFGKPTIQDKDNAHYMYPNEARLRNMTYAMSIHYDVDLEFVYLLEPGETPQHVSENMLREMVTEQLGGKLGVDFEAGDNFFQNEAEEYVGSKMGNFKLQRSETPTPAMEERNETELNQNMDGGAGERKKKPSARPPNVQMTTAIAARLRELDEKSRVSATRQVYRTTIEKVFLGKFPIMLQSEFCILNGIPRELRYNFGECRNDLGGYFIIDGKEKTVVMQEKFGDNMMYIEKLEDDTYRYVANIRSVSENASKPVRTMKVKWVAENNKYTNNQIVVSIPNVRDPVPLFIVFRALGVLTDLDIVEMILLNREKYAFMEDLLIPSVHDAGSIMTQQSALLYIAHLTKYHTVSYGLEILNDFFFPHIGESNYLEKAYFLGNIVFQLLCVATGLEEPTDRDNYKYNRVEVVGSLIFDLFREYYTIQQKAVHLGFERKWYMNQNMYEDNLHKLVFDHYREIFKENRMVDDGFKKAFKGNWGSQAHTKRIGVVQDLNRLSFNSMMSHLRKTNLPLDSSVKLVGPRVLHNSHWGFIDPIDTPDGGNIGLHKTLAILTTVSRGASREPVIAWLREHAAMKRLEECTPLVLSTLTKVMVNGLWAGSVSDPIGTVNKMKLHKRNALLPIHLSATFDYKRNIVFVFSDAGRLCRPVFYVEHDGKHNVVSYDIHKTIRNKLASGSFTWKQLITGFNARKENVVFQPTVPKIYELHELYADVAEGELNPAKYDRFLKEKAVVEYIDPNESENTMFCLNHVDWTANPKMQKLYTHMEIHESLTFGMMCNLIIFPENNPPVRNSFSCGQSKQAVSMYHTNYPLRMDKTAVVLNSGQIPLVKSRFLEYINHEENPYGENAIVAIMCYTGYNVEDAILINEGALQRGLFRTTYYTTYEEHEEKSKKGNVVSEHNFACIESLPQVLGMKAGYDYSKLDGNGLIRENVPVDEKTMLIGMTSSNSALPDVRVDMSVKPKKGQLGIVDKSFMTEGEEGERIAKVRVRDMRVPSIGDKMASRAGQKGTIGMVIRETDMPFTKDGIRPDLIINPHAIPTRMTIGQLVESITGKACANLGAFADCTAFNNKGSKVGIFGEMLSNQGFHSSGNELLYNGMTGEQIETEIFIGPTYYMRLKHMVKDKINYRATGPRAALTRQPVSGRANDGGLRIGEMERDVLISHGISNFLRESMMERGDKSYLAVCNKTGMIAIYNPAKNLFVSPMADGPLVFNETLDGSEMVLDHITKFGRSFSIVSVPYTFKLLMQELQAINIQMRIITEDNLNQMETLAYSKNMEKLTYDPKMNPTKLAETIKLALRTSEKPISTPVGTPLEQRFATRTASSLPSTVGYAPESLASTPSTVGYVPGSPGYAPTSPTYPPGSPGYAPTSPTYPPGSPEYTPSTVGYVPGSPASASVPSLTPSANAVPYGYNEYKEPVYVLDPNVPVYTDTTPPPGGWKTRSVMDTVSSFFTSSPSQQGGANQLFHDIGKTVFYAKSSDLGLHPATPWRVSNIGDTFYTIETNPENTQLSNEQCIQVVYPNEIYDPVHAPANMMGLSNMSTPIVSATPFPSTIPAPNHVAAAQDGIHIKIINNGTDNSVGDASTPSEPISVVNSTDKPGLTKKEISVMSPNKPEHRAHHETDAEGDISKIDFNNLVIKKV